MMIIDNTNRFLIIAITSPYFIENEGAIISNIIEKGEADLIHIRKPQSAKDEVRKLIRDISPQLHHRLKLHDHFSLMDEFNLAGIHLNNRNPEPYPNAKNISKSLHYISELDTIEEYDYVTLSPIFDSISKNGYTSSFDLDTLASFIKNKNVIALGGVTPFKIPLLKEKGFYGAAMLGYFFNPYTALR